MRAAYVPREPGSVLVVALTILALLLIGARIARGPRSSGARVRGAGLALAWLVGLVGVATAHLATRAEPAGWRMLALVGTLFAAMKLVVVATATTTLSARAWWSYALFWVGMDPRPFEARGNTRANRAAASRGFVGLLARGSASAVVGVALFVLARTFADPLGELPAIALVFCAASLTIHFGLFALNAGLWRRRGVRVREPFAAPHRARSLREFWARRWNRPFSELTAAAVYAPLARRSSRTAALLAGFLFSGLLHELAISAPVRAGYGLPTLYFLLQGVAVLVEERRERRGAELRGALARVWCAAVLFLPLPLVFHAPFRDGVVLPLLER